jgi:glutamine amidotransferase
VIVIVNYGVGNIGSISNMLNKLGVENIVSSDHEVLYSAEKLILPGVGSFDVGMSKLNDSGISEILNRRVLIDRVPILGICLGMQLMTKSSQEGNIKGLSWIDSNTIKFDFSDDGVKRRIPHMGWNRVLVDKQSLLFKDMYEEPRFYFVHSYYVECNNEQDILSTTNYGFDFTSAIEHKNIFGVQFHPEKSHKFGLKLLKNYSEI